MGHSVWKPVLPALPLLLAACAEPRDAVAPGVLTVAQEAQASWVRNFNPLLADGLCRFPTRAGIYEPLTILKTITGEWVPWLALAHEWSPDARALTFTLRPGVRWSAGWRRGQPRSPLGSSSCWGTSG